MKLEKNWLEWIVFACSLALTLSVIGFLAINSFKARQPAQIEVTLGKAQQQKGVWKVPVRAENKGDETAAVVSIGVTRAGSDETGELEFDYLPRHSSREGWVAFSGEPQKMEARVRGYQKP
jgi:uncharacterized protein (TIGR02588 family)